MISSLRSVLVYRRAPRISILQTFKPRNVFIHGGISLCLRAAADPRARLWTLAPGGSPVHLAKQRRRRRVKGTRVHRVIVGFDPVPRPAPDEGPEGTGMWERRRMSGTSPADTRGAQGRDAGAVAAVQPSAVAAKAIPREGDEGRL